MGLTFKKEAAPTGLASVANPYPSTTIKWDKKVVGSIAPPNYMTPDNKWQIRIMVKDKENTNPNCDWKWITFKARFDDEPAARVWLQASWTKIQEKYELHCHED